MFHLLHKTGLLKSVSSADSQTESRPQSDYDRYLEEQLQAMEEETPDDRCYPEMPEGQFVRGH